MTRKPWQCEPPSRPRPIAIIGAGGIVRDAHLPAYKIAGFPVVGIYDIDPAKAQATSNAVPGAKAFESVGAMVSSSSELIFDVAVPANAVLEVLKQLPDRAAVLIQKPLGENLEQARAIADLCHMKSLAAAVNFQLRWAPYVLAAADLIARGVIGDVHDMEVRVTVYTPWHLWTFLESSPRVEILYHSVHYIDLIRSFLGEPSRVHAMTVRHPETTRLHSTRSCIALDYGPITRANIQTNHGHKFGLRHQESYIKWEGTRGAIKATLGLLMNYPKGEPDTLECCTLESDEPIWRDVPFEGSWFPHAFIGSMSALQRFASGETAELPTRVDDAVRTMAVVEACYADSERGGTAVQLDS